MGHCAILNWLNPLYTCITAAALIPSALAVIFLSFIGYGAETYIALSSRSYLSPYYFSTFLSLAIFMYLFETATWRGPLWLLHLFLVFLTFVHMGLWMLVRIEKHPTLPLLFAMLLTPVFLTTVQWLVAPLTRRRYTFLAMRNGMVLAALALLTMWLAWIYHTESYWHPLVKRHYAQRIGCPMPSICDVSVGTRYKGGHELVHVPGADASACCDQCEAWNANASHTANPCTHWTHVAFPTGRNGADKYGWGATCFLKGGLVPAAPTADGSAKNFTSGTNLPSAVHAKAQGLQWAGSAADALPSTPSLPSATPNDCFSQCLAWNANASNSERQCTHWTHRSRPTRADGSDYSNHSSTRFGADLGTVCELRTGSAGTPNATDSCRRVSLPNTALHWAGSSTQFVLNPTKVATSDACLPLCEAQADCIGWSWRRGDTAHHHWHKCFLIVRDGGTHSETTNFDSVVRICDQRTSAEMLDDPTLGKIYQEGSGSSSSGTGKGKKRKEEVCQGAFILYMAPFLLAVMNLVLAFILHSVTATSQPAAAVGEEDDDQSANPLVKLVQRVLLVLVVGTYFNSVVSTGSYRIASAVNGLLVLCFCILGTVVAAAMKWPDLKEKVMNVPIIRKLASSATSIWLKAFFVLFLGPLFVVNVFFMLLNHLLKKHLPCMFGKPPLDKEDSEAPAEAGKSRGLLDEFSMSAMVVWPWNTVLRCSITVGVVLMSLQVVIGKAVTLFLAWLNAYLSEGYTTNEVIVIFFCIGLTMFLLPPVPGVPVYLAGGVILTNALQKDHDFWAAAFITSCICFGIKLVAIVCQQKVIGELCGKFVAVRSAVSINSMLMRAIKFILSGPVDIASVCILCGGPDWPTSVTTGILGLSLVQMLKGSLPVFFVILPTCMAGALQLRAAEGGSWAAMAAMMLTMCGVVQSGAGLGAMHFIEETIDKHEDELRAMPDDEAVKKLDLATTAAAKERAAVTEWKKVPTFHKLNLMLGSLLMSCSIYIVYLFPLECFQKFEVTSSIEQDLNGDMWSIVKPKGWDALYLCFAAMVMMWINGRWVGRQMREFNKLTPEEKSARLQEDGAEEKGDGAPKLETGKKNKAKAKMEKKSGALAIKKSGKNRASKKIVI